MPDRAPITNSSSRSTSPTLPEISALATVESTYPLLAIIPSTLAVAGVGAVGVPVSAGDANPAAAILVRIAVFLVSSSASSFAGVTASSAILAVVIDPSAIVVLPPPVLTPEANFAAVTAPSAMAAVTTALSAIFAAVHSIVTNFGISDRKITKLDSTHSTDHQFWH